MLVARCSSSKPSTRPLNGRPARPCCAVPSRPPSSRCPDPLTSARYDHPQPGVDPILNSAINVLLLDPGALRNLERMVAAFDDEQVRGGLELADDRLQLGGRSEGIAGALHKQHRRLHVSQ